VQQYNSKFILLVCLKEKVTKNILEIFEEVDFIIYGKFFFRK
jgi:hypothetical protein